MKHTMYMKLNLNITSKIGAKRKPRKRGVLMRELPLAFELCCRGKTYWS